jgi:hypothetical protein
LEARHAGSVGLLVLVESGEEFVEVGGGELPTEGPGGGVVTLLELGEPGFDLVQAGEVVRTFASDDRKDDPRNRPSAQAIDGPRA